ncbi:MAG: hypothetical protein GY801_09685, partial [bacterium]|nr:hypothetical protein [bacterium]
ETRFNIDEFPLDPGQNEVRIPIGAVANVLDVSRIEEVHLFLIEPEDKVTLYFDNIRLE